MAGNYVCETFDHCVNCGEMTEPELCLGCGASLCTPCFDTPHGLCRECQAADAAEGET